MFVERGALHVEVDGMPMQALLPLEQLVQAGGEGAHRGGNGIVVEYRVRPAALCAALDESVVFA